MQLIVLGMHRSGTSVLARLLNLMGAYFGPEGVSTGANQENPKGFWERRDVRALNDSVLHAVSCDWNRVLQFDATALSQAIVADFDKRASKLILEMDAHRPWLLKEPRLCLLMPLWRKWLEAPVCISIYRNPVEVASSLHRRNGIPIETGMVLWERYVRSALKGSAGLPEVVVSHRDLMRRPTEAVETLFRQLAEQGVAGLRMPAAREIEAFVQDDLYRERDSREGLHAYAKARQIHLFKALEAGRRPAADTAMPGKDEEALERYEATLPPIKTGPSEEKMSETREATLRGQLALREQEIQFVRELLEQAKQTIAELEHKHGLAQQALEESGHLVEAAHEAARGEAAALAADIKKHQSVLAESEERLAAATTEIQALRGQTDGLRTTLQARDAELISAQDELATSKDELTRKAKESKLENEIRLRVEANLEVRYQELTKLTQWLLRREQQFAELSENHRQLELKQWAATHESAELKRHLEVIRRSHSWRLAAPLRMAERALGGSKRQAGELEQLQQSGLFDESWYLQAYPDVARSGMGAAEHFLKFGVAEGRDAGPDFSTVHYLKKYPDVADAGINPLLHYITHGKLEGRSAK